MIVRSITALAVSVVVAGVVYWVGAVIALLAMHGLPLGSPGGPPTRGDLVVHLSLALAGAFAGARLAMRLATHRRASHGLALGVVLGILVIFGFSKPNNWPEWFGAAMSTACILGSVAAAAFSRLRN